jgi:hypothetical protein
MQMMDDDADNEAATQVTGNDANADNVAVNIDAVTKTTR